MKWFKYISLLLLSGLLLLAISPQATNGQDIGTKEAISNARQAGIEASLLNELTTRAKNQELSEQAMVTVIQSATEMARNKLPYERIFDKTYEGLAKGVSPDRIASSINSIQQRTNQAAKMVDPWIGNNRNLAIRSESNESVRNGLIVAISKVNSNEASAAAAGAILDALSSGSLSQDIGMNEITAAIMALPEMSNLTERPGAARAVVIRALNSGFSADRIQQLPSAIKLAQIQNRLPAEAMSGRTPGPLRQGHPVSELLRNINIGVKPNPSKGRGNGKPFVN